MANRHAESELTLIETPTDDQQNNIKASAELRNKQLLDYMAFASFLFQTSSVVLLIRYSRMQTSDPNSAAYATASIITSAEIGKIIVGFLYCLHNYIVNQNQALLTAIRSVCHDVFGNRKVLFLMSVPALTYFIQNFLMYRALALIDSSVYQIVVQLKTVTTACFGMCLLSKKYSWKQWISFVLLSVGVAIPNLSVRARETVNEQQLNIRNMGLLYVLGTTLTSAFAGTFMEMQLKGNKNNIFIQNIQLSLFALIGCVINSYFTKDMEQILLYGFFYGYTKCVWAVVALNVLGGYFVATVIKRASVMTKTFLSGIAILFIIFYSYLFLNDDSVGHGEFGIAVVFVLFANYLYAKEKVGKTKKESPRN